MADNDKKAAERVRAEALFRQLEISADGLQISEAPDFILPCDNRIIGIEVTMLMRTSVDCGQPENVRDSEQNLIVDLAKKLYIEAGGGPINVSIMFNHRPLQRRDRQGVAEWICDRVRRNIPPLEQNYTEWRWQWRDSRWGEYPECLHSIDIFRLPNGREIFWTSPTAAWTQSGVVEVVRDAIVTKEKKRPEYMKQCDECWLILAASYERGASMFEWSSELETLRVDHGFDRIYFDDPSERIRLLSSLAPIG